ncbi:MAG: hypothetical protein M1324_00350, partial [Patescibacteria group bacterium]|nr:hypothetical protein [Patescibacteria group bacterium]
MELERKIMQVQMSTRTLFKQFTPIHDWLRLHLRLYYIWSLKPYSRIVHWVILFLYILSLPFTFSGYFSPNSVPKAGATTYDFPRWEWANP